jgi:hypothetical protein
MDAIAEIDEPIRATASAEPFTEGRHPSTRLNAQKPEPMAAIRR